MLVLEAYWLVAHVVLPAFAFVVQRFDVWWQPALAILIGLGMAGFLALVRGRSRRSYGMIEVCFACCGLAATALAESHDVKSLALGYVGSVYVAIRGFTNIWETLTDAQRQRIWATFYEDE